MWDISMSMILPHVIRRCATKGLCTSLRMKMDLILRWKILLNLKLKWVWVYKKMSWLVLLIMMMMKEGAEQQLSTPLPPHPGWQ